MRNDVIIVTGGDTHFFGYIASAWSSLCACGCAADADIGVLDQGLSPENVAALAAMGYRVATSQTRVDFGRDVRDYKSLGKSGLLARTELRDYFPGYRIYLWFDPDAWAQTPEFFAAFINAARCHGAAIALENGAGYRRPLADVKWWLGNLALAYGPVRAAQLATKPLINNGLVALRNDVEHWERWQQHYLAILRRTGKHLNQHALFGALHVGRLDVGWIAPRCNWICMLSPPTWDAESGLLYEPSDDAHPLSVLHLAGPDKGRDYELTVSDGSTFRTPLTYDAINRLRCQPAMDRAGE
jgi:hypothetical protein